MYIKLRKVFVHTSLNHPVLISSIGNGKFDYQSYHSPPLKIGGCGNTSVDQVLLLFERNAVKV